MDGDMQIACARLARSWVEPDGKDSKSIGNLDVLLEVIADHQRLGGREAEVAEDVAIRRLTLRKLCVAERINAREIFVESPAPQRPADLTLRGDVGAGRQDDPPAAGMEACQHVRDP